MRTYSAICIFVALSSCAVGPDYRRPTAPMSAQFKEAQGQAVIGKPNIAEGLQAKDWKIAEPRDSEPRGAWWRVFNDDKLNELEEKLDCANQTIINAYYNYSQACALVDSARAALYPTLVVTLDTDRQKTGAALSSRSSSSSGGTGTGGTTTSTSSSASRITKTHEFIPTASWELDIWGLARRQVEAAADAAQSSAALLAATRLSAEATLAQYYYELRGLDRIQQLLDHTVANDKKLLQLTRHQYASGVASEADVVQAESVLEAAQAQALNNGIARGQYEHAIAVLIGVPPATFSLSASPLTAIPPAIPVAVPSTLLERRPDIAQAERLMAQANAQIGVAVAAYFPTVTLTGSVFALGGGLGHLTSLPSVGWIYGAHFSETVLDGGLRNANVRAAKAGYQASVAAYRQVVLSAFQNVEDNLIALRILQAQAAVQEKAVNSARRALQLVTNQYKAGTVPYSSVITAQNTLLSAEQNAANVAYARMTAAVGLIKALGGGWCVDEIFCKQMR